MNQMQIYGRDQANQILCGQEGCRELQSLLSSGDVPFCRVYSLPDRIVGALMIDLKSGEEGDQQLLPYFLSGDRFFVVAEGEKKRLAEELRDRMETGEKDPAELQFCELLEAVLTNDLACMQQMEAGFYRLEENLLGTLVDYVGPTREILCCRKQLLEREFYYQQLADLCDILSGNKNDFFSEKGLNLLKDIGKRADRLCGYVQTLRDYLMQIWELYEQQVDVQQNKTMRILTVVTTIFLPLTLIAGWYGMNFEHMPGLESTWGYWITLGAALCIALAEIIYFKIKKYF